MSAALFYYIKVTLAFRMAAGAAGSMLHNLGRIQSDPARLSRLGEIPVSFGQVHSVLPRAGTVESLRDVQGLHVTSCLRCLGC